MTQSISDKLLKGLYYQREEDGSIDWGRITEIIPEASNWRIITDYLCEKGLIVPRVGGITHLTDQGIMFCETTSFLHPSIPIIELEDL